MTNNCREDLRDYALRKLGHPLIQINVHEDQINDRINDALARYWEFHTDGSYRDYLKVEITDTIYNCKTLFVDEWIYQVLRIVPIGNELSSVNLQYESFMQNIAYNIIKTYDGLLTYTVNMSYIELLNSFFNRNKIIEFIQNANKITILSDISQLQIGDYLLFEVYKLCDPDVYQKVWNSPWIKDYASALIKKQWGQNMSKYAGFTLPGGITINGLEIYQSALEELAELENRLKNEESEPIDFFIG